MLSKTGDFAPVPPSGELDERYASSFNRTYSVHYM